MRKIVSSLDIGSDSIKFIVGEFVGSRLHILSASKVNSHGVKNGKVIDIEEAADAIKKAVENASKTIGIDIHKTILGINSIDAKLAKTAAAIKIESEDFIIDGDDVTKLIQKSAEGKVPDGNVLVGVIPVEFTIDNDEVVKDPKFKTSQNLGLKAIVVTSPKEYISSLLGACSLAGLKVVDVIPNAIGDYYTFKNKNTDTSVGAIVNLGSEVSTVSIFNKGILTNTKSYPVGASNIINDISFINRIDESASKAVFKDIVLASSRLANPNEYRIVNNVDGEEIKLNQYDLSEISASRIEEILNLAKKQINILTKKEISYIIVSGGLTELRDFTLSLESSFGKCAYLGNVNLIGARDNSYSSSVGILKYFEYKLQLRGKSFSIFNGNELEEMNDGGTNSSVNNDSLLGKVFGYFFDN